MARGFLLYGRSVKYQLLQPLPGYSAASSGGESLLTL